MIAIPHLSRLTWKLVFSNSPVYCILLYSLITWPETQDFSRLSARREGELGIEWKQVCSVRIPDSRM